MKGSKFVAITLSYRGGQGKANTDLLQMGWPYSRTCFGLVNLSIRSIGSGIIFFESLGWTMKQLLRENVTSSVVW